MPHKIPILLSFYALSNGRTTMLFGQITYTGLNDLSFKDYNRRKTFRTLFSLYQTKPYDSQEGRCIFDHAEIPITTDAYGSFYLKTDVDLIHSTLKKVVLVSGEEVKIIDGLYALQVHHIKAGIIVISDIDDTLMHSFIYRKIHKFRTLMFTTMENRKAVDSMQDLIAKFTSAGAASFYLSNSEQNLYPLIYRFLWHNRFPAGPLFLKKLRGLWDVLRNIKIPFRNIHKQQTLEDILTLFPDRKFVLMGDNTQEDLSIYLESAKKFPDNIRYIIIRKVVDKKEDNNLIEKYGEDLKTGNITLYYSDHFPNTFRF